MAWHRCDPVGSRSAVNWGEGCSTPERASPPPPHQPTRAPLRRNPPHHGEGSSGGCQPGTACCRQPLHPHG